MEQQIAIYGGYAALILAIAALTLYFSRGFWKFLSALPCEDVSDFMRAAPVPKRQVIPGPIIVHLAFAERIERSPEEVRRYREAKAQWELWAAIEDMTR